METKTLIFYDFEATSVSRDADPISMGLVVVTPTWDISNNKETQTIRTFYAEFNDYSLNKCDDWVKENVVDKLQLPKPNSGEEEYNSITRSKDVPVGTSIYKGYSQTLRGTKEDIGIELKQWLSQFENPIFIGDFDVIDKPMLIDLITDWNYSNPCGFISNSACHYEENKRAYVCDKCNDVKEKDCQYKIGLPKHLPNIKYFDFYDLHTMFFMKEIDPDTDRELFVFGDQENPSLPSWLEGKTKHNALYDAYITYLCYNKIKQ